MCSICLQGRVKQSDKERYRGKIKKHNNNTKWTTYNTRYPSDVINSVLILQKKKNQWTWRQSNWHWPKQNIEKKEYWNK